MNPATKNGNTQPSTEFRIGEWLIKPQRNCIERDGETVQLQHLTMELLVYLAERAGAVVQYDEFLDSLWAGKFAGEDAVHRRVADLRRSLGDEAKSPRYIETIPKRGYRLIASVSHTRDHGGRRYGPLVYTTAVAGLIAAVVSVVLLVQFGDERTPVPTGSSSVNLAPRRIELLSSPTSAEVFYKRYDEPDRPWEPLGVTPLVASLPDDAYRLRLMAAGHETVERALPNPGVEFNNVDAPAFVVELPESGSVPEGMVHVPPIESIIPLWGYARIEDLGSFHIDRTEVRNADYAEFVRDGGYSRPELWRDFLESEDAVPFAEIRSKFSDSTGFPGPAGWIDGRYRPGTENLPVTGVSWYEAMAYARYRGMTLPSARHWARAALGVSEWSRPLASALVPAAHLAGAGPLPVDDQNAISTFGALNLIGNVREWTRGYSGRKKLTLGGSFATQHWGFALPTMADPLERLPYQGFRLAQYDEKNFEINPIALDGRLPKLPSVTDAHYAEIVSSLRYRPGTISVKDVEVVSSRDEGAWIRKKIMIQHGAESDALPVLIFEPKAQSGELQSMIFLSPGSSYTESTFHSDEIDITRYYVDFIMRSGRALVWPILSGTHERYGSGPGDSAEAQREHRRQSIFAHRQELGRVLDYIDDDPKFDRGKVGLLAISYGANIVAPALLATEPRIETAVLLSASLIAADPASVPLLLNPNTFWPRVTLPVLVGTGRYDFTSSNHPEADILIDALGTPEQEKQAIVYESSHWPFPPRLMAKDVTSWLDRYLGPVN